MRGFTLPELLTTLAVMVVLTVMAAAAMAPTISGNRAYTAQSELATSLALARSEAGRRGVPVGVNATAPVTGNEFGGGWFIWVDENSNGMFDAGEAVVRTHEALPSSAVTIASNATGILFNAMGFTVPAGVADVTVCPVAGARTGYAISVQPSGLTDVNPSAPC